ncbi:MAG: zf-HC2 domain-containing protein [Candidatus Acidiferrales bacterium]
MTIKKCDDVSKQLIAYLDRRANSADRAEVEDHLASCASCRMRAEEFRMLFGALDHVEAIEPSTGFDARVRERIAQEARPRWFSWLVPQPRLAFSMALLLALSVWMAKLPRENANPNLGADQQDFEAIKDLDVLENYDVLSKFDALSEVPADQATEAQPAAQPADQKTGQQQPATEE